MVFGVAKTVASKVMVSCVMVALAAAIAWRRSVWPATSVSVGLFTTNVDGTQRSSNVSRARRLPMGATCESGVLRAGRTPDGSITASTYGCSSRRMIYVMRLTIPPT